MEEINMLNFVLCDDEANMLNKISLLFEKVFVKDDIDEKIDNVRDKCSNVINTFFTEYFKSNNF